MMKLRRGVALLTGIYLTGLGCSGSGSAPPTPPPLQASQLAFGAVLASDQPLAAHRAALATWWQGQNYAFDAWRMEFTSLDECDGWFRGECAAATATFEAGGVSVRFEHADLGASDATVRDTAGSLVSASSFTAHQQLTPRAPALRELMRTSRGEGCVIASGTVFPALQSEDVDPAVFFVDFTSLRGCDFAPPSTWSQEIVLSTLSDFYARYIANSAPADIAVYEASRAFAAEFLAATEGKVKDWTATVQENDVGAARRGRLTLSLRPEGQPDERFHLVLVSERDIGSDPVSQTTLGLEVGACVRFEGTLAPTELSVTEGGLMSEPTYNVALTAIARCHDSRQSPVPPPPSVAMGDDTATGIGLGGAVLAGTGVTTVTTTVPIAVLGVTASGEPFLVLGEAVWTESALSAAGAVGFALVAVAAFHFLDEHMTRISNEYQATVRAAFQSDGEEFLAFARHSCPGESMASTCVRTAYRQAAAFVASSPARLAVVLGRDAVVTGPARRWQAQWGLPVARFVGSSEHPYLPVHVAERVAGMSPSARGQCRQKVDLAHELVQEIATYENSAILSPISEHGAERQSMGDSCYDLYLLEHDYLSQSGVFLIWKEAWEREMGSAATGAAIGWSDGTHAQMCRRENERLGTGFLGLGDDKCTLRIMDENIQCVCRGTREHRSMERHDAAASRRASAAFDRWQRAQAARERASVR